MIKKFRIQQVCTSFIVFCLPIFIYAQVQPVIGLELYSLRNQFAKDVPGTLEKVRKMGFKEVELAGTYGITPVEFKKLTDKNQLQVISVGADFQQLATKPEEAIRLAQVFGAKYVVCFWLPHEKVFTQDDAKHAINVLNKAGKILADSGLSLCYHPHGYEFRPSGSETLFDDLVTQLDPRYVNFEMDVFWITHPGQDPVKLLQKYPNRFPLMHLKDRRPGTEGNQEGHADVETNVVLGTGDVGIAAVMKAARKAGVKHYFIEDESTRSEKQIPESVAFLKNLP